MELTSIVGVATMPTAGTSKVQANYGGREFEALLYRTMLQGVRWTDGVLGGGDGGHAVIGGMLNDLLAQEMARQQNGFGAMVLRLTEQGGEG